MKKQTIMSENVIKVGGVYFGRLLIPTPAKDQSLLSCDITLHVTSKISEDEHQVIYEGSRKIIPVTEKWVDEEASKFVLMKPSDGIGLEYDLIVRTKNTKNTDICYSLEGKVDVHQKVFQGSATHQGSSPKTRFYINLDSELVQMHASLVVAVEEGQLELVQQYLEKGGAGLLNCDPRPRVEDSLSRAVRRGHRAITQLLLERGTQTPAWEITEAKMEPSTSALSQLLETAIKFGHCEIALDLIKKGAQTQPRALAALGCRQGHLAMLEAAREMKADLADPEMLCTAVLHQRVHIVKFLFEKAHALPNVSWNGCSPLSTAAASNEIAILELLLEHWPRPFNAERDKDLVAAFTKSCQAKTIDALQKIVKYQLPDHVVVEELARPGTDVAIVSELLHTPLDLKTMDNKGRTVLHILVDRCSDQKMLPLLSDLLKRTGQHPDIEDASNNTPLHWAVRLNQPETVKLLMGHGADPHRKNKEGASPLTWANGLVPADAMVKLLKAGGSAAQDQKAAGCCLIQ